MTRRVSPSMVVALLALFFALGGGAYAAKHYLINSTKQINPKVLKKLKGQRGPRGLQGLPGTNGTNGTNGAKGDKGDKGDPGPLLTVLPSGATVKGVFSISNPAGSAGGATLQGYSFPVPMPAALTAHYILKGDTPPAQCPGSEADPKAAAGHLCIYESRNFTSSPGVIDENNNPDVSSKLGFVIFVFRTTSTGYIEVDGSWAATAP